MEIVGRESRGQACSRQAGDDDIQYSTAHASLQMFPRVRAPPQGGYDHERLPKDSQKS